MKVMTNYKMCHQGGGATFAENHSNSKYSIISFFQGKKREWADKCEDSAGSPTPTAKKCRKKLNMSYVGDGQVPKINDSTTPMKTNDPSEISDPTLKLFLSATTDLQFELELY